MITLDKWLHEQGLELLLTIVVAAIFYYIGTMALRYIVKKAVQAQGRSWHRKDIEKRQTTLTGLFVTVWRILVVSIGSLIGFKVVFPDVSFAPIFASAGIVGIGIGFGAQSLVKDFLSGIFIISENQYRVGDVVDILGASGTVERIGTRSTVLRDADGNVHYFPNGMVQHVINKTMGYSKARFSVSVGPSTDIDKAIKIINDTGEKLAAEEVWKTKILEAPAFVSVDEFTTTAISLLVSGKTQPSDQWSVTAEMRRRLLDAFDKKDIEFGTAPVPKPLTK